MDDENDFEDFEDDSVDPFASSESEIDDSDVENDLPAERIVEFYSLSLIAHRLYRTIRISYFDLALKLNF